MFDLDPKISLKLQHCHSQDSAAIREFWRSLTVEQRRSIVTFYSMTPLDIFAKILNDPEQQKVLMLTRTFCLLMIGDLEQKLKE